MIEEPARHYQAATHMPAIPVFKTKQGSAVGEQRIKNNPALGTKRGAMYQNQDGEEERSCLRKQCS